MELLGQVAPFMNLHPHTDTGHESTYRAGIAKVVCLLPACLPWPGAAQEAVQRGTVRHLLRPALLRAQRRPDPILHPQTKSSVALQASAVSSL